MSNIQRFYPWTGQGSRRQLTFRAPMGASGYTQLPDNLTINGTTVAPTFVYRGEDATDNGWTAHVGDDLALAGTGADPTVDEFAPGIGDSRVAYLGGKVDQATGTTYGDLGSDDFVYEVIFRFRGAPSGYIFGKTPGSGTDRIGIVGAAGVTYFVLGGVVCQTSNIVADTWYHLICFGDRSGSMVFYYNATATTATSISAVTTVGDGFKLTIGSDSGFVSKSNADVAHLAMWHSPAWLDTHLQADVARERFYRAAGVFPVLAKGTAIPTSFTRSTLSYLDKYDSEDRRIIVPVGANWPRVCQRFDSNGTELIGYLPEIAHENEILYSEDFSNVAWTATRATVSANGATAPDGESTADGLIASSLSNTHYIGQSIASDAGQHVFSVWLKAGAKNWAYINIPTVVNANAYFDLANCALGTVGAAATATIEQWGRDWCRCCIVYTGGAPAHSHDIYAADSNGQTTFAGNDVAVSIWMWGAQHAHPNTSCALSYVKTTAAAATYTADVEYFAAGANIGGESNATGTVECKILMPNIASPAAAVWDINDGGASADRVAGLVPVTTNVFELSTAASGGNAGSSTTASDVSNGVVHTLKGTWKTNLVTATADGVPDATPDTSADMPDELDRMYIGCNGSGTEQLNGLISDFRVYKKVL